MPLSLVQEVAESPPGPAAEIQHALALERPAGGEQLEDLLTDPPADGVVVGEIVPVQRPDPLGELERTKLWRRRYRPQRRGVWKVEAQPSRSGGLQGSSRDRTSAPADSALVQKKGAASTSTTGPRAYHSCFQPEPERWYFLMRGSM